MLEFKNKDNICNSINKYKKITNIISFFRLFILMAIVVEFILMLSLMQYLLYGIIMGISIIIFILFILFTNKFYSKYDELVDIDKCIKTHELRRLNNITSFYDYGDEFKNKDDYKIFDLDLFGKNSLYQYLSSCKTKKGKELLAKQLTKPDDLGSDFTKMVDEFSKKEDVINLEAALYKFKNNKNINYDELLSVSETKIKFKIFNIIPLLSFIGMIAYIFLIIFLNFNPYVLIVFAITNLFLSKILLSNGIFKLDGSLYYDTLNNYIYMIDKINENEFESKTYNNIKKELNEEKNYLIKLKRIYSMFVLKKNIIIDYILNTLFIIDFFLIINYNLQTKNVKKIKNTFNDIAKIEVAISLANIGLDNDISSIPEESDEIDAIEMYHPLVKNCVPNDIKFNHGMVLTGSNMSGKTTFMRTLAINQTLKNACGLVAAKKFASPNLKILTSLRANDMLNEGISTFYAEILRMKEMMHHYKEEKCLILVDEIFKGTNTNDRISASKEVILKLLNSDSIFIISTHDFELGSVPGVINYHFNETYIDDKISFDYKIKEGISDTKNALYLLKMADII